MNEADYQYSFVVSFDLNKKLFFIDREALARFDEGPVYVGEGVWKNLDEKTEGIYDTIEKVLYNALQEGNKFVINAIEEALKEHEGGDITWQ
jgi:hypothetical protein